MDYYNYDNLEDSLRYYGGSAGKKVGVIIDGENYLIKYPGNLKNKDLKNIDISYSNSPICEYIGSHIYDIIGISVHETQLGIKDQKLVVACKDFVDDGVKLIPFSDIKVSSRLNIYDYNGNVTDGLGTDLDETIYILDNEPIFKDMPNAKEYFWNMFIVDALIGNSDRNNTNWGILVFPDKTKKITPVFDNGNCLNNKWSDKKMKLIIENENNLKAESYNGRKCIYTIKDKEINPYHFILSMENADCNKQIMEIIPKIDLNKINKLIDDIEIISKTKKEFYKKIIYERYSKILEPTYYKLKEQYIDKHKENFENLER